MYCVRGPVLSCIYKLSTVFMLLVIPVSGATILLLCKKSHVFVCHNDYGPHCSVWTVHCHGLRNFVTMYICTSVKFSYFLGILWTG